MIDTRSQHGSTIAGAIFGNYRIIEPLDRGGMGSVYRAQHAVLGRPAAVKILRPELTANDELVRRFVDEAKAATMIRHPGIVEVYDFGTTHDGIAYIVMELLEGVPLSRRLAERGWLPEPEVLVIARGIASALRAAHREGIIHRDLKPENIFLVPDPDGPGGERIKVLDFGIAKLVDPARARHTQTGVLMGTPVYMAPEQARAAHAIDHRADLYSLGCMLHELLVGRPPFQAVGAGEIIAMHLFTPPEPPSRHAPVSPELDRIVLRLLEKEPQDRFRDAGELIDALDAMTGQPGRPSGYAPADDSRPYTVPQGGGFRLPDEQLMQEPGKKSSMGLVAGLITVAIAAAVAVIIATRGGGGGDDHAKPAVGDGSSGEGSGEGKEPVATPTTPGSTTTTTTTATTTPPPTPPAPTPPAPGKEAGAKPGKEAGAKPGKEAGAKPASAPPPPVHAKKVPSSRGTKPAKGSKSDSSSGPVTHPDGPITSPDTSGPVTSPSGGPSTDKGSPINLGVDPDKKPAPTKPEPPPPPPPPPPPTDKLPDKPTAEGAS